MACTAVANGHMEPTRALWSRALHSGQDIFMLKFYFNGSPNPTKVALFLEEAGLPYEPIAIDPRIGDQFKPDYVAINPNAKVPAIDDDGVKVFDSNAILLYLAEKTGKFLPADTPANRGELLSWLMFAATGVGPYFGQAVHFKHFARRRSTTPTTATNTKRCATPAFSTNALQAANTWWAKPTRLSTWMSGVGRACCPSSPATMFSRSCRTLSD